VVGVVVVAAAAVAAELALVLGDVNKQLLHVVQTFKQEAHEACRVRGATGALGRDVEVQIGITRHHVRDTIAVVRHRTEATTRTQLSTQRNTTASLTPDRSHHPDTTVHTAQHNSFTCTD